MRKMKRRAISPRKLKQKKVTRIPLTGAFKNLFGNPETRGSWFIYGESGNGKSTFLMQLAKELTKWYKVDYNSLEEEDRASMTDLMEENRMHECRRGSFMLLPGYNLEELEERISKPRSANVVIIDSVQYFKITTNDFMRLVHTYDNKLFIINSHADGKKPVGSVGRDIKFHSDVKIWVEGFKATSRSRMSRGKITDDFIIWEEGAKKYWNKI